MVPKAEKSCCDEAGKCKRQSKEAPQEKECQRMPLEPPSISGAHYAVAIAALPTPVPELPEPLFAADFMDRGLLPVEHSPPDIQVLNATFLV
jgi:hypothetical protein